MDKSVNNILLTTVVFFYLVMPTSILIDKILCVVSKNTIHRGFQLDEGTVIGILERLLILIMGILGSISGVGFLIAAKTMVRYGEFESETKGSNFRSKYLIGTLLSVLLGYIHYLIFNSLKSG